MADNTDALTADTHRKILQHVEKYIEDMGFMTGQEFYNRFMKEYSKDPGSRENSPTWKQIDSIAKRAAGLGEDPIKYWGEIL